MQLENPYIVCAVTRPAYVMKQMLQNHNFILQFFFFLKLLS